MLSIQTQTVSIHMQLIPQSEWLKIILTHSLSSLFDGYTDIIGNRSKLNQQT